MATRLIGRMAGLLLGGCALAATADAQAGPLDLFNPLGFYVGAGVGHSTLNETEFDQFNGYFRHLDGQPLGWNAVIGIRPLPILGAEAEFIDFGTKHLGAGAPFVAQGSTQQFLGGQARDRAGALFAVGYLPLPIPFLEPFAKLGWAQVWQHDTYTDSFQPLLGTVTTQSFGSQSNHPSGAAYGAGLQFHFEQIGVRAQYERISGSHSFGGWDNPSLLSLGVNWTF